ncbi:RTA1 domain containing protein [Pyrenophora tritici-repentis]|nr:RTA1 domain containing protein [Pyrenophora tritici-repentis]
MTVPPPAPAFCTEVSPACPVEGTILGYYPNLSVNIFFAAFFGVFGIAQLALCLRYKTWMYSMAISLGCLCEVLGYIGRIMMNDNPFTEAGFQMQICCLIIAPAFVSAGIYVTLKHLVLNFGESWSRLRPGMYTYVFIVGDVTSLILQGAGGGIAASSDFGSELQDQGTDVMIAGVVFQVFTLAVFGLLLAEYAVRTCRHRDEVSPEAMSLLRSKKFRGFVFAVLIAFSTIFSRCIYRIPELTGGWRSELMREEFDFIILEGVMVAIAVAALTIFHPGYCFPALANASSSDSTTRGKV